MALVMMSSSPGIHRTRSWPSSLCQLSPITLGAAPSRSIPQRTDGVSDEFDDASLAHFIAPVTEEDDPDDFLSLSAGIIPSSSESGRKGASFRDRVARRWDRYVHQQRNFDQPAPPEWTYADATEEQQVEMATTALSALRLPVIIVEPTRGRAQEILASNRERRSTRTLTRRSHSWKEPALHLFTVLEADEDDHADEAVKEDDERPLLKKKHDSGFLEGSWGEEERPLLRWD